MLERLATESTTAQNVITTSYLSRLHREACRPHSDNKVGSYK